LLDLAQSTPNWNFLGLEIREPLVIEANLERDQLGLTNLHYVFANANTCLTRLLPPASLAAATIQFPDPWFKRRHQKRRVVQPELVDALATCLQPNAWILLQSDVLTVATAMKEQFAAHQAFTQADPDQDWLISNPLAVRTEREVYTLEKGLPVYRAKFVRHTNVILHSPKA
jgi:tRNA (guanine-N7-)-methyltransferase